MDFWFRVELEDIGLILEAIVFASLRSLTVGSNSVNMVRRGVDLCSGNPALGRVA